MSHLLALKNRIKSVHATHTMTSAMKLVSLARLKRQQTLFYQTTAYCWEMNRMMRRLTRYITQHKEMHLPLEIAGHSTEHHYILGVITSDEGFSSSALNNVIKKTKQVIEYLQANQKKVSLFCLGTKGSEILKKTFPDIPLHTFKKKEFSNQNIYEMGERFACDLMEQFDNQTFDVCLLIYNHFDSLIHQQATIEQVIPVHFFTHQNPWDFLLEKESVYKKENKLGQSHLTLKNTLFLKVLKDSVAPLAPLTPEDLGVGIRSLDLYDYEPSAPELLNTQLPAYLSAFLTRILIESSISDNASRLLEMDNATKNAEEILTQLKTQYRHIRQEKITDEIIGKR